MLQAGVRDQGPRQAQPLESCKPLEIRQPGVGDVGVRQAQRLELATP